jgi:hypothetical protein
VHEYLSLELREERELRVIYNGALMRIFGPRRQKELRDVHTAELHNL